MSRKSMDNDQLGARMKEYESQTTSQKLIKRLPILVRIDGKNFSSFTKGLKRPYDERLSNLMCETAKFLLKETNANCVYHQSDEITLVWYSDKYDSQTLFDGKVFKITSTISAIATAFFNKNLSVYIPEKSNTSPRFDCRVFNVPTLEKAASCFYWREKDATKNSITMASSAYYSHKELDNKNSSQKQEMLFQKGVNWNDYPNFFKKGSYIQRKRVVRKFTSEEIETLPNKHLARQNPDIEVERWEINIIDIPPMYKIKNKVGVIMFGEDVILNDI